MVATFSSAQKLLEAKQVAEAFREFSSFANSENCKPNDVLSFQLAQKLGTELVKAERYKEARATCEVVLSWIQSRENGSPSLAEALTKNSMGKPQLAKMEVWASLTAIQCLSKLSESARDDERIQSEAASLSLVMRESLSKNLLESSVVLSSAKKLRGILFSRKTIDARLAALSLSLEWAIEWEVDADKYLLSVVRDLRVKRLHTAEIEKSLTFGFKDPSTRSPKALFDFGLWLNDSKDTPREKAARFLSLGCQTPKECLFAAKIASQVDSMLTVALDTIMKGLVQSRADSEGLDPLVVEELFQLDVRLATGSSKDETVSLLCQRRDGDVELADRELEFALKMKRLEGYLARIQSRPQQRMTTREKYFEASALRLLRRQADALKVLQEVRDGGLFDLRVRFLKTVVLAESGKSDLSQGEYNHLCRDFIMNAATITDVDVFSVRALANEIILFGWMMGFYEPAVALSKQVVMDQSVNNSIAVVAKDDDVNNGYANRPNTLVPLTHFLGKKGSEASRVVDENAQDADAAIRALLAEAASARAKGSLSLTGSSSNIISTEFEHVYRALETLNVLGDLYRERGLSRLSRYYHSKALGVARSRGLRGEERRCGERLEVLDAMKTPRFLSVAGEGGIGIVSEDDDVDEDTDGGRGRVEESVQGVASSDVFEGYFRELHEGRLRMIKQSQKEDAGKESLFRTVQARLDGKADDDEMWYERAVAALVCLDDADSCLAELEDRSTHATDTLQARAVLRTLGKRAETIRGGLKESSRQSLERLLRRCAERCTSDLVVLRELYSLLLALLPPRLVQSEDDGDDAERAYLASALVGLTLRAERAQMLLDRRAEGEDDGNADLYHWHRLARIADSARVQRSQVRTRLHAEWVVVTVAMDLERGRLVVCRTERDRDVVVETDLGSSSPGDKDRLTHLLQRYSAIMEKNLASTNGSTVEFAQKVGKTEKGKWWDERYQLEEELSMWLDEFQACFLGWRAVLLRGKLPSSSSSSNRRTVPSATHPTSASEDDVAIDGKPVAKSSKDELRTGVKSAKKPLATTIEAVFCDERSTKLMTATKKKTSSVPTTQRKTTTSKRTTSKRRDPEEMEEEDPEIRAEAIGKLEKTQRRIRFGDEDEELDGGRGAISELSETFARASVSATSSVSTATSLDDILRDQFASEKDREIARMCLESGLSKSLVAEALVNLCPGRFRGRLDEARDLVDRLKGLAVDSEQGSVSDRLPVLLCLSGSLQQIPWESLPCLDGARVSRIPSLPFALESFSSPKRDQDSRAFVVDPDGNLQRTQEALRPKLEELVNDPDQDWEGAIGPEGEKARDARRATTGERLRRYLEDKSFVLYCGHGAGEEYLSRDEVSKLRRCAPVFLMGCSSGSRKDLGWFEPNGVVDAYALARSPLVVGNLWNVTDKDIDRFTLAVLEDLHRGKTDLLGVVARNRKVCKLRMLVGAAPVCFGVPWYL